MGLCGLAVGWRIERGAGYAIGALVLVAAFQFAATWIGMYLGLVLGNEQAAGQASILVFPVTMLSNVFVPTSGMPAWLRAIADWNPDQRPGRRHAGAVRQPDRARQRGVAAAASRPGLRGLAGAAAGDLRAAVRRALRPRLRTAQVK